MKNIYALRKSDGYIISNISGTNILPDECDRYYSDEYILPHVSGAPTVKVVDGEEILLTEQELIATTEYKAWWNAKIEAQLEKLDIKRIRSVAEISDENTGSQDKQTAKATIKILNEQAAALRAQILK